MKGQIAIVREWLIQKEIKSLEWLCVSVCGIRGTGNG